MSPWQQYLFKSPQGARQRAQLLMWLVYNQEDASLIPRTTGENGLYTLSDVIGLRKSIQKSIDFTLIREAKARVLEVAKDLVNKVPLVMNDSDITW